MNSKISKAPKTIENLENISIVGNPNRIRKSNIDFELADKLNEYYSNPENLKRKEETPIISPVENNIINPNIVNSDYIHIPGQDFIIAIGETDFNLNYENANKAVLKRGLAVPRINQFMTFHNYVIDCYKNNKPIFDSERNPLSEKTKKDLYTQLTSNCWTWLNGKFNLSNNKNTIDIITGLDLNDNLITKEEKLEDCLMQNCYVDFTKLNKNGIPNINSTHSNQKYIKGENIYYSQPIDERVASFYASFGGAYLDCYWSPSDVGSSLGVFGIAQVFDPKLAGGIK